jgi:hypothetical protein
MDTDKLHTIAKRIVTKHFFSGIKSPEDVDKVWDVMYNGNPDEVNKLLRDRVDDTTNHLVHMAVWSPYEHYDADWLIEQFEMMYDSIIIEFTEA